MPGHRHRPEPHAFPEGHTMEILPIVGFWSSVLGVYGLGILSWTFRVVQGLGASALVRLWALRALLVWHLGYKLMGLGLAFFWDWGLAFSLP